MSALLNDPSMREIIIDFCDEADDLFQELEATLAKLEDDPSLSGELEKFGQIIDRIMGAAKSIGAIEIATFCELGKTIGYKSSQVNDRPLVEVVIAVLFDALDILKKLIISLRHGNDKSMDKINTKAFVTRLRWLSEKFKNIERASCEVKEPESIDDLLKSLGL